MKNSKGVLSENRRENDGYMYVVVFFYTNRDLTNKCDKKKFYIDFLAVYNQIDILLKM